MAQFAWDTETKRTSREVLEDAGYAKTAGLAIDIDQVQELTGYKLAQAAVSGPDGSGMSLDQLSSLIYPLKAAGYTIQKQQLEKATQLKLDQVQPEVAPPPGGLNSKASLQTALNALQIALNDLDGQGDPSGTPPSQIAKKRPSATGEESHAEAQGGRERGEEVLKAFAEDTGPAAKAVQELLKDFSKEACEKFLAELPKLVPDDPVTATVLADAMAEAMGKTLTQRRGEAENAEILNREYKRERDGKFAEVDHPRDFAPGDNPDRAETQAAEIGKGKKAVERCLAEKVDVPNAVSRGDVGLISLVYSTGGDDPHGMARFLKRPEAKEHLAETLVRGKAKGPYQNGQKLNLEHAGYVATLRLTSDEKAGFPRNWVLTGWGPSDKSEGGN